MYLVFGDFLLVYSIYLFYWFFLIEIRNIQYPYILNYVCLGIKIFFGNKVKYGTGYVFSSEELSSIVFSSIFGSIGI